MLSIVIFLISITSRWITLIPFEETPMQTLNKYRLIGHHYSLQYFGSLVKCLEQENVESAILLAGKSDPSLFVFHRDGKMEKYNPAIHKTKLVFVSFKNLYIAGKIMKIIETMITDDYKRHELKKVIEKNYHSKIDEIFLYKLYMLNICDNATVLNNPVLSHNILLANISYLLDFCKKQSEKKTSCTHDYEFNHSVTSQTNYIESMPKHLFLNENTQNDFYNNQVLSQSKYSNNIATLYNNNSCIFIPQYYNPSSYYMRNCSFLPPLGLSQTITQSLIQTPDSFTAIKNPNCSMGSLNNQNICNAATYPSEMPNFSVSYINCYDHLNNLPYNTTYSNLYTYFSGPYLYSSNPNLELHNSRDYQ